VKRINYGKEARASEKIHNNGGKTLGGKSYNRGSKVALEGSKVRPKTEPRSLRWMIRSRRRVGGFSYPYSSSNGATCWGKEYSGMGKVRSGGNSTRGGGKTKFPKSPRKIP